MRLSIIALAAFTLTACATAKETYTPSGEKGYTIDCSGSAGNWGMCTQKAGELCGSSGYTILGQVGDQSTMVTSNQYGTYATPVMNRSMVIQCGNK
ncbi:hypothetical protein FX987_04408 [Vreelandella titanicae]|uniref:Lipoprotein n=1 Tax=Vreelandella titanicae TaxID=664683 RepID=A0AAP9T225_9GAMM|nr:hypothetical protein FX987_04408 [Halomonas titanicae]